MTQRSARRLFRTVLFTDISGSTAMAAELGDRKWRRTLAAHHAAIRREIRRHRGREVDTAGDGFFAVFENPTDAVRCAAGAVAAAHALGLPIRAGVHTGEVEASGASYGGIAVHIGARLLSLAGPRQVLVSNTVRELVSGSGHEFDDFGVHELKGVPGEWHVYSLILPRFEEGVPLVGVDDEELRAITARRQRLVIGALGTVIVVLVLGLGGLYLVLSRPADPARGANTVAIYDSAASQPVRGIRVDPGPNDVAVSESAYWTANVDAGTVTRIETASGSVTSLGQAGARPGALAVTPSRLWVLDRYSSRITILDGRQGTLLNSLPIHASAIAASTDQMWVVDDITDVAVRLDPLSGAQVSAVSLPAPAGATDVVVAAQSVWIAAPRAKAVFRLDPATATVTDVSTAMQDVQTLAAFGNDLWLVSPSTDSVSRLDIASGRLALSVDVCDTPVSVAPTASGAWVACSVDRSLWRIDRTGTVTSRIELDGVPTAVAADGERALVTLRRD
jgi:streptogramin lyase